MHWIRFNEWCARHSHRGKVRRGNGIQSYWSHTALLINNLTTPLGPVTREQLAELAQAAVADAAPFDLPWIFGLPDPWLLNGSLEEASTILEATGLRHMMAMTVMETRNLKPPARPLPSDVDVRRVRPGSSTAFDALDLNSRAYGLPRTITDDVFDSNTYFSDPSAEFGIIVYDSNGIPVSTATAIDFGDDWIYIAEVATDPKHRQKGYAELAMRAAIETAPNKPIALDASRMGEPLYVRMGFEPRFRWNFWIPA
jgi:GNAT superfamily N-acetyltransferase